MSRRLTTQQFIERAKEVHGDKYDYSKVNYIKNSVKVCIICSEHGEFLQTPNDHLNGHGCKKCGINDRILKRLVDTEYFIKRARNVHGDKYDYSKTEYSGNGNDVIIICPIHGEFKQIANNHLNGSGCPECALESNRKLQREKCERAKRDFVENAKNIHGDRYDYSKVKYVNNHTKVCIICPKHGEFWQVPNSHLMGHGCPHCNESKLEKEIEECLRAENIFFERQKRINWLGKLSLDFYLPKYNVAIECQGIQHFVEGHFFEQLKDIQKRDKLKKKLCNEHGIKLLYYSNLGIEYLYNVFEDKEKLFEEIKKI
jgi:very-short-patch-repair endonuclease